MSLIRDIKKLIRVMIDAYAADIHTHMPAQVISYDATANTVSVQPCIKRVRTDDPNNLTTAALPVLEDVPVKQFGSGDFVLTVPPSVDSYGLLHVNERELEQWLDRGGVVDPATVRKFDLSDAIFDPGMYVINGITGGVNTDRIEIRSMDGTVFIAILDTGEISIENGVGTITMDATTGQVDVNGHLTVDV